MSLCLDFNTERRTRRLAQSQPLRWRWRDWNWPLVAGYGSALLLAAALWRCIWLWAIVPLWDTLLRR